MDILNKIAKIIMPPNPAAVGDPGMYYYIKCNRCGEIIKVRINPMNDLSRNENNTLFVRKVVVGQKCYSRIDAEFYYNNARSMLNSEISGGELVTKKDYEEQQRNKTEQSESGK